MKPPKIKHQTILLIEDDAAISAVLTRYLTHMGYEVRTVSRIDEASRSFMAERPDCILLDMLLEDGCGCDLYNVFRNTQTAVIIFSILSRRSIENLIGRSDFEYIPKPFDLKNVSSAIESNLSLG